MANLVRRWGCGVVLSSDGSSVEDIRFGIQEILAWHDEFKENAEACRSNMTWESQIPTIMNIVGLRSEGSE